MKIKKWIAVVMTALMILQALAFTAIAEELPGQPLSGSLRISGLAFVGGTLSADFSKAEPEGISGDDVTFRWTKQEEGAEKLLSEEKTYTITGEDLDQQISLTVTGRPEKGYTGTLTAKSNPVSATKEEAEQKAGAAKEDAEKNGEMPEPATPVPFDPYAAEQAGAETPENTGSDPTQYGSEDGWQDNAGVPVYYEDDSASWNESEYYEGNPEEQSPEGNQEADPAADPAVWEPEEFPVQTPAEEQTETWEAEEYAAETPAAQAPVQTPAEESDGWEVQESAGSDEASGMESVNETFYVYDPVTGEETVIENQNGNPFADGADNDMDESEAVPGGAEIPSQPENDPESETENPETQTIPGAEETTGDPTHVYQAAAIVDSLDGLIDFGTVDENQLSDPEVKYFSITNTGQESLHFVQIAPEHFMVGDIYDELAPGETANLFIQPRETVKPGEYRDQITYRTEEGAEATIIAVMTVEQGSAQDEPEGNDAADGQDMPETENVENPDFSDDPAEEYIEEPVGENPGGENPDGENPDGENPDGENPDGENPDGENPDGENPDGENPDEQNPDESGNSGDEQGEEPVELLISLEIVPTALDFGSLEEGYAEAPEAQHLVITNTGSASVILEQPSAQFFTFSDVDGAEIEPGESVEMTARPSAGLPAGEYTESAVIGYLPAIPAEYSENTEAVFIDPEENYTIDLSFVVTAQAREYTLSIDPKEYDFGSRTVGYQEAPAAAAFTAVNEGNTAITLNALTSDVYDISAFSADRLEVGEKTMFTVRPKTGLGPGDYPESLTLSTVDEDGNTLILAVPAVKFSVKNEEKVYRIVPDRSNIDFGALEAGYQNAPNAQTVTITNTGNTAINLKQQAAVNYVISSLTAAQIAPGKSASFSIAPKTGLAQGQYFETITVTGDGNASASVNVSFLVGPKTTRLTGIVNPAEITGIPNGSEKTAQALRLPGSVAITTTNGNMLASVTWDVAGCAYDPSGKTAQTFTVNGKVTLPGGIQNPDNIPLVTAVRVTVNGRNPIVPDPSGNRIIGVNNGDVYTIENKISFTADGAGYNNAAPVQGDVRYVPYCWRVLENRIWDCAPFSATFRMGQGGSYTLAVTFLQQQFNGSTWVNTSAQDVKNVNFTVKSVRTVTMTPVPGQVRPARTGDETNTLPLILTLCAASAALAVAAIILIRRRRK